MGAVMGVFSPFNKTKIILWRWVHSLDPVICVKSSQHSLRATQIYRMMVHECKDDAVYESASVMNYEISGQSPHNVVAVAFDVSGANHVSHQPNAVFDTYFCR